MRLPLRWNRLSQVQLFTDGAIRLDRKISGLGAVVMDMDRNILHCWSTRAGPLTNNEAEYAAVIFALEKLRRLQPSKINVFSDSRIVVDQMCGLAATKAPGLQRSFLQLRKMVFEFDKVIFQHIPRERNRLADALANDVADGYL
jgi:ribonuclease HI